MGIDKVNISKDKENGITLVSFRGTKVIKSKSLSDEGCSFLNSLGADIVLHFDQDNKLTEIELIGFDI